MARAAQVLPPNDELSDEDSLVSARNVRESEELRALLVPRSGSVTRGAGGKPQGLGARRVRCEASLADAVIEERRR